MYGRGRARGLSQMKVVLALLLGVAAAFAPAKPLVSAPVRLTRPYEDDVLRCEDPQDGGPPGVA